MPWLLATLVIAPLLYTALRAAWHFTIDDSGISFAYAKHLANGDGPVAAVGGPWVEGYSNALWVFLLVPFSWLNLPLAAVSKVLGVIGLLLTLWAGAGVLLRSRSKPPLDALVVTFWALGMVVCLEVAVWTVAGLENALLSALLIGMVYFDVREHEAPARFPVSAVLGFCLCITRPEGPAYALPLLALKAAIAWWQPQLRPQLWRALVWFAAPLAIYHGVHFAVFREFVPNTYFAKPRSDSLTGGMKYLRHGLIDSGLAYALPLAALGVIGQWRSKIIPAWVTLFGGLFVLYSGGDWMPHARFISFFAPAVLLLAAFGAYNLVLGVGALHRTPLVARGLATFSARPEAFRHWTTVGCLLLITLGCGWRWQSYQLARLRQVKQAKYCHFCQRSNDSKKLQSLSKKGRLGSVSLLTHDFGGPSWLSDDNYYPIDFLGLCDATVPRLRKAKHALQYNYPLFAHLLHEQDNGPDWIYLPRNFWPRLKDITEHDLAYVHLKSSKLPHGPSGSYLELHRGKLVDFFPPFLSAGNPVAPRPLGKELDLLGFEITTTPTATEPTRVGSDATIRVSIAVATRQTRPEGQLGIAINDDAVHRAVALDRGLGIARHLLPGEPLRFDFDVTLPPSASGTYELRLGYSSRALSKNTTPRQHWSFLPLDDLQDGATLPYEQRTLQRYPNALPSPSDPVLFQLQPEVATLLDLSFGTRFIERETLAARLMARGRELEGRDDVQAYLAYVWATQIHPPVWRDLTKPLLRIRPSLHIADFGLEILLLREHYANPTDASKARLVAFYTSRNKLRQAEYFGWTAAGGDSVGSTPALSLDEAELARWSGTLPLHTISGDRVNLRTLLAGPVLSSDPATRAGGAIVGSKSSNHAAQGELVSPPFELSGSRLTLMVGGGKASERVGVELLVDDAVVYAASGLSELDLSPILWDVDPYVGKQAQLRVNDHSSRRSVYVGGVELWK